MRAQGCDDIRVRGHKLVRDPPFQHRPGSWILYFAALECTMMGVWQSRVDHGIGIRIFVPTCWVAAMPVSHVLTNVQYHPEPVPTPMPTPTPIPTGA